MSRRSTVTGDELFLLVVFAGGGLIWIHCWQLAHDVLLPCRSLLRPGPARRKMDGCDLGIIFAPKKHNIHLYTYIKCTHYCLIRIYVYVSI